MFYTFGLRCSLCGQVKREMKAKQGFTQGVMNLYSDDITCAYCESQSMQFFIKEDRDASLHSEHHEPEKG